MKTLVLMRHARSGALMTAGDDTDRPLTERGRVDALAMARGLAARGLRPDLIVSSPALRARTTAELCAREFALNGQTVQIESGLYNASVDDYLGVFKAFPDEAETVLVVAHNPTITECATRLALRRVSEMSAGSVVAVGFETARWRDLTKGQPTVLFVDQPARG